ncbi:histidine kinase [Prosthecobacter sp.]|jgi:signal transduction histidine kinase|uniref:histidine kinase n=1 Tax=Prosthecobacter sp. TaxID=1965333 RepID=UPI0037C7A336
MSVSLLSQLSAHYLAALRTHLEQGRQASLLPAHALGTEAVHVGLETLDLAKVHHQALAALILPDCSPITRAEMTLRAEVFFTEALVPIEKTHRFARESGADLQQLQERLGQRTLDLADSNRDLQQGITERMTAEAALEDSERISSQLLLESRQLEQQLKDMTRKIMSADEVERKKMSLQLHDDIGQSLLGIHMRLLSLKKQMVVRHEGITQEIATTQRLVEAAVKTINQFAHEFGIPHEK